MIKQLLLLPFALNFALANLTDEAQTAYDAGDKQKAAKIWQKACESGKARGCVRLGFLYQSGKGVEQDDVKARKFYEKACDARGCLNLARRLESSDKKQAAALRQKAQKLHEKECKAGLAKKCMEFKKSTNKGEKHEF